MTYIYRSPRREPGVDWIKSRTGVAVNLDKTELGPWYPEKEFAFDGEIPPEMAGQMGLELVAILQDDGTPVQDAEVKGGLQ